MRYVFWVTPLLAVALAACNPAETPTAAAPAPAPATPDAPAEPIVPVVPSTPVAPSGTPSSTQAATAQQTLHFVGPMDLTLSLATEDNFETAVMTDNSDRALQMRSVPAASGIRMEDGQGAMIHFKNGEGTVEFSPGNPIAIQEFKQ